MEFVAEIKRCVSKKLINTCSAQNRALTPKSSCGPCKDTTHEINKNQVCMPVSAEAAVSIAECREASRIYSGEECTEECRDEANMEFKDGRCEMNSEA